MTIAIATRQVPPSLEFDLAPCLERDVLDAGFAVLAPHMPDGSIAFRMRPGRDMHPGHVQLTLIGGASDRDGTTALNVQVQHPGATPPARVLITHVELPADLRGRGLAVAMISAVYEAAEKTGAVLLLCNLSEMDQARAVRRGAHVAAEGVVQVIPETRLKTAAVGTAAHKPASRRGVPA